MRGMYFEDEMELPIFVEGWFKEKKDKFFQTAYEELVVRWNKLVAADGGYIEKWQMLFLNYHMWFIKYI